MKKLDGKIIVVTGGDGLLGKAFIETIEMEGGVGVIADISYQQNNKKEKKYFLDITDANSIKSLLNEVSDEYGKIDGWVNNAYPRTKDWGKHYFEEENFDSWRQNTDMHLNGYALCCQLILEYMKANELRGSVVNLASIYGILGPDFSLYEGTQMKNSATYAAIKGGIINLSRYLASYYGPLGIRINCVSPGGIFDNQPQLFVERYINKTPLRRMGDPKDIASGVAFLLSDEASYITGHNLLIDGGWSII